MNPEITTHNRPAGIFFSFIVLAAWASVHIYGVFFHVLSAPLWSTLGLIALQCWLYTGIFIVAHDTMHCALFKSSRANAALGNLIMFIYAGFSWRYMQSAHMKHHKYPGTAQDPDFNATTPNKFWPWYLKFFTQYFGWRQLIILSAFTLIYIFGFGAAYLNTIIMWAVPAILSSVQLFYFGTYLTHRHSGAFKDEHNARTNDFPVWLSLLTCFHFGYHHEHHLYPHEPWWRLPLRKRLRS